MLFRKKALSAAIAATLAALVGCSDDTTTESDSPTGQDHTPVEVSGKDILNYIDPFVGTGFNGHTFPGAVVPEGFVQLSPDNQLDGWHSSSGYHYDNSELYGFSHTHLSGTGIGDLGDVLFMPYTGDDKTASTSSKYSKNKEFASPGFYEVTLDDTGIKAELTATKRVGVHRYTYPEGVDQKLKIDLGHTLNTDWGGVSLHNELEWVNETTVRGMRVSGGWAPDQRVYFYATFSKPIKSYALENESTSFSSDTIIEGEQVVGYFTFEQDGEPLEVKVGLSPVETGDPSDEDVGARGNLLAEADDSKNFDAVREDAEKAWIDSMANYAVSGGRDDVKNFFTALYHTKIAPMVFQDVDGRYPGMERDTQYRQQGPFANKVICEQGAQCEGFDGNPIDVTADYKNYTVYSMWDTFRALHPLKTITEPEKAGEYAVNLVHKYKEGGILPKWELHGNYTGTMVGYPAVSVIADAMAKGLTPETDEFKAAALEAALASSTYHPEEPPFTYWDPYILDRVMAPHIAYPDPNADSAAGDEVSYIPADEDDFNRDGIDEDDDDPDGISDDTNESVSYGLEIAYYDWTIAKIAEIKANSADIKDEYLERSRLYAEYFDHNPEGYFEHGVTGFMRPRVIGGEWRDPFDPFGVEHETGDYTEGNAWQWTWFVPHDINGLKQVMGGGDVDPGADPTPDQELAFKQNLDALFDAPESEEGGDMTGFIGQYVHGNEPDHHVAYLYNHTDTPWKTQEIVDRVLNEFYFPEPEGVVGNEDVGAMSAWFVMSALGFYQIAPGDPTYTIGRPLFDEVTIPVEGGTFTITAENNRPENKYVQSVEMCIDADCEELPLSEPFFPHDLFEDGNSLKFVMGSSPAS